MTTADEKIREAIEKLKKYRHDLFVKGLPRKFNLWGEIAAHVQMHTEVLLWDNGRLIIKSVFSNGDPNKAHGMAVTIYLKDVSGKDVYVAFQKVNILHTGGKWNGTQTMSRETKAQLSEDQAARIVSALSSYVGHSLANIDAAQVAAEKAKEAIGQTD